LSAALPAALRALRSRNFRVFFAGQFVSLVGMWMQTLATSWLVYRLTGSALLLGITAGVQQLPILFLAPLAGVWAERVNRRRVLIITQSLSSLQALALAVLTFSGAISIPLIIVMGLLMGVINAVETPTRQAFLLELIEERRDLPNAIALQATMWQAARFIGPSLAGLVLAGFGEAWCFLLNALSYLAIVAAYVLIKVAPRNVPGAIGNWRRQLAEGFRFGFGFLGTRRLLLLLGTVSFFTASWSSLMPIFAAEIFAGDSRTLGFLIGAVGMGALGGGAWLALRSSVRGLGGVAAATTVLAGAAMTAFSQSTALALSLGLLVVFGFGLVVTAAASNTLLQTLADEDKRARVISLYVMFFLGMMPIGNFVTGAIAERAGAPLTFLLCGLVVCAAGAAFALGLKRWNEAVRPIYIKRGVIAQPDK